MTAPAAQVAATPGVPSPTVWPDGEVSFVAFRCKAFGATESQTREFLTHLSRSGVRRVRAYVDKMPEADFSRMMNDATGCCDGGHGRGDLIIVRSSVRWPWRTSTGMASGGAA